MSTNVRSEKIKLIKEILKSISEGGDVSDLKKRFRELIESTSPYEIVAIEQQLLKEGFKVSDILRMCDLHVELFRESLQPRGLEVPEGHPLDLLMRENSYILKITEGLKLYASALKDAGDPEQIRAYLSALSQILKDLRRARSHYRKTQMLIFPYLERRGITAVPRVLWAREDQAIMKLRRLSDLAEGLMNAKSADINEVRELSDKSVALANEFSELVFREDKILFPAVWTLFSEGEWAAISEIGDDIGWLVDVGERKWTPKAGPVLPYELKAEITPEQVERLPPEFRALALSHGAVPDNYSVRSDGDLDLGTGFLSEEEVKGLFRSLPLEITYADTNDRVKFYTESALSKGFVRTKTVLGRRVEFCHPPRLEEMVRENIEAVKKGNVPYREYWTRIGDRIIRVLIAPVKGEGGKILGTVEMVEDLTEVVNNPDEVKKKILVL